MEDLSAAPTKDSNTKKEVFSVADHEVRRTSPTHVILDDILEEFVRIRRRILHRVPPQVRENKKHIYDPVVLSLGPYHHGKPQFRQVEELKDEVPSIIFGAKDKGLFRSKILERVVEIRSFYGGLSTDEYDDEALAEMMLRDACFILYFMDKINGAHILRRLGMSGAAFMYRDFNMLENQIPLWVIKLLISLTFHDKNEGKALVCNFLSRAAFGDCRPTQVPWEDEEQEHLHLLEVSRTILVKEDNSTVEPLKNHCHWIFKYRWGRRKSSKSNFEMWNSQFRSVTELKAKGIRCRPSSNCLKDIRFNSYAFYGKLQLPIWFVTNNTNVFFSNIIALEISPETDTDFAVTSYIDFMKSLIDSPKDVKELREKGILFSCLANDEEVVKMFKQFDIYAYNKDIFLDVKMRIDEHCNSKAKTWMAELAYTYFRSPWTAIALFAAIFLLCLSFLQTYYTLRPPKRN